MESEYDRKFEEMKKYIPFLESMINRLEANSSSSTNPRQAQLDKIRSLRDLLLDKNKRMKMENLQKCEQVLVNLYNKVEQKDSFSELKPTTMDSPNTKEKKDLEIVRNKLKTVTKLQEDDTLPEIARANDVEQFCTPGSKEPALFQRRPNMPESQSSKSHTFDLSISPSLQHKRNYTRVLVSPERSPPRWSTPERSTSKPLYSRRSPARSKSPTITKKEKKKSKSSKSRKTKDLNITLNVPEEKLNSLNTKDILSRILTCSDGDVDINTLRELRSQIRDELKHTGDNNDISDLILKSYHKKSKNKKSKYKRKEVEEGEISDSESEAIDSIYGSLVVMEDGKKSSVKTSEDKKQPRKIQICLVINKGADMPAEIANENPEFEIQNENETHDFSSEVISVDSDTSCSPQAKKSELNTSRESVQNSPAKRNLNLVSPTKNQSTDLKRITSPAKPNETITIEEDENVKTHISDVIDEKSTKLTQIKSLNDNRETNEPNLNDCKVSVDSDKEGADSIDDSTSQSKGKLQSPIKSDQKPLSDESSSKTGTEQKKSHEKSEEKLEQPSKVFANFYKPLDDHKDSPEGSFDPKEQNNLPEKSDSDHSLKEMNSTISSPTNKNPESGSESGKDSVQIPLLNEPTIAAKPKKDVVSEIDILQALKNEILSDKIAVPIAETITPALHQPKLTKVSNAQEVAPKKRISIEKYKALALSTASKPLFVKHHDKYKSGEEHKKQSLKLTEKECERFNFPKRVSIEDENDISDEDLLLNSDQENSLGLDDIYGDLAPKSPDHDITCEETAPPVIIPVDPVKTNNISSKSDIDMRKQTSLLSPPPLISRSPVIPPSPIYNIDNKSSETNMERKDKVSERPKFNIKDPRMRRDFNKDSPNPHTSLNPDRTPRSAPFPNMTPNMTPSYMPSMTPIMTPNARTFEMTPTHQSFELDNFSKRKHVYAPFSGGENRDREMSASRDNWDVSQNDPKGSRRSRWERNSQENPVTPRYEDSYKYNNNRSRNSDQFHREKRDGGYSRAECPNTPIPSFGWMECPPTPASSFGRQDPPMTPSHSFGRSEYPGTPIHTFGRSDCPSTPVHPFGRSDAPLTPSHPFGRTDATSFGKQEGLNNANTSKFNKDPRYYSRHREQESSSYIEKERNYDNERSFNRGDSYRSDSFKYDRERSNSSYYASEHKAHHYDRDRREQSDSSLSKDSENDRLYTRNRDSRYDGRHPKISEVDSRRNQRERSIGRTSEYSSSARERSDRTQSSSVGRNSGKDRNNDDTLSFRSDTGRSLTINTSVKSTFQDFLDKPIQVFDYTFDARRQRAASVGRSLVRDNIGGEAVSSSRKSIESFQKQDDRFKRASSTGRELTKKNSERSFKDLKSDFESFKSKLNTDYSKRHDRFKRASSMGRELVQEKSNRSFKDIKADFESFKSNLKINKGNELTKIQSQDSSRSRKDNFKAQDRHSNQTSRPQYSPRKNNRDPRMQKEKPGDQYSRYKIDRRASNSYNKGIVYSSDNIAKGTIMGSGFGVRNYKIPKIKRTAEESEPDVVIEKKDEITERLAKKAEKEVQEDKVEKNTVKNKEAEKSNKKTNEIVKIKQGQNEIPKLADASDDSPKRVTRSRTKLVSPRLTDDDSVTKKRRCKKAVIHDSDSDSEKPTEPNINKKLVLKFPLKKIENKEPVSENETENKTNEEILDSGFGIDDIEIFPENIGSDSVIDNINALIAHLDDDIDTSKIVGDNFNTNIEKMMESIDSPEGDSLGDISEVIENELNENKQESIQNNKLNQTEKSPNIQIDQKPDSIIQPKDSSDNNYSASELMDILNDSVKEKHVDIEDENNTHKNVTANLSDKISQKTTLTTTPENSINEAIVSTSQIDHKLKETEESGKSKVDVDQSVPDSTISKNDVTDKCDVIVADSTNEIHCELSSDVTSTHDISETSKKEMDTSSSSQLDTSSLNSIGSLLSILQDKSKIKELLAVLGDKSGENEKIKKKLERLSEIVSDEDDDYKEQGNIINKKTEPSHTSLEESSKRDNDIVPKDAIENEVSKENEMSEKAKINNALVIENKDLQEKPIDDEDTKQVDEKIVASATAKDYTSNVDDNIQNDSEQPLVKKDNNKEDIEDNEKSENEAQGDVEEEPIAKLKKTRIIKTKKNGRFKKTKINKNKPKAKIIKKGTNRELKKLQDDIKEMFMSDDILNATGIRMCRLAKMVHRKEDKKDDTQVSEIVTSKKGKATGNADDNQDVKIRKKPGPKPKVKLTNIPQKSPKNDKFVDPKLKYTDPELRVNKTKSLPKPGPKSKTKQKADSDPYEFDTDSITDTNTTKESEESSSDSESDSLASSLSLGSTEVLAESKKKIKRKRSTWKTGVIPKNRKKKEQKEVVSTMNALNNQNALKAPPRIIPDYNCFTDKTYCFDKDTSHYECRLCEFTGEDIVNHYKKQHPHTEIPLSRMNPQTAEIAIKQCEEINFQAISKIPSKKYICRFCHKEYGRNKSALELFFWHVVSNHTGEYKHLCSECVNMTRCPFNLDIPPPPKDLKGQLIGYICGKCNFTQISLENLKTHVIIRHNDEQTEVYTINLAKLSKKAMKAMLSSEDLSETPRVLRNRSIHSNQSATEHSDNRDDRSEVESSEHISEADTLPLPSAEKLPLLEVPKIEPDAMKSKLTFENDEFIDDTSMKIEQEEHEGDDHRDEDSHFDDMFAEPVPDNPQPGSSMEPQLLPEVTRNSDVIMDYPHFKLNFLESGVKEYVCCINGNDSHYKTTLLISMKKHIQTKHSEKWDGYCCVCKVIVTLQGVQSDFRDCLTHFLDKHMDDFPVLEKPVEPVNTVNAELPPLPIPERISTPPVRMASPYLAVRPLAELISRELVKEVPDPPEEAPIPFPKIENLVSLSEGDTVPPQSSPVYPCTVAEVEQQPQRPFLYEEFQAEVMSKKHRVVLDAMMPKNKLVRVFKCAGRFCSFSSDSADSSLVHASTHQRIGGEGALNCAYCNFDACDNAIDLVMHVFKMHSQCQYSCSLCFYRAAASQLVGAHCKRVHNAATPVNVLRTTGTAVPPDSNNVMLSREQAVLHFICNHDDGNCNFKTFTSGKFVEHMMQKHASASSHPCQMCPVMSSSLQELLSHMKSHGMNLYQCTWCIHGADNEASLLSHVASCHPDRQPQAYIRVITNKDGSAQRRVLPLAFFNKTNVPQEDVSPSDATENPVREAERSIELEKLIGLTSTMSENTASQSPPTNMPDDNVDPSADSSNVIEPEALEALTSELLPQNIKKEPEETRKQLSENSVICLDSDEEESNDPISEVQSVAPVEQPAADDPAADTDKTDHNSEHANISIGENVTLKKVETPRSSVGEDVTITRITDTAPRTSVSDDDSRHAVIELSDEEQHRATADKTDLPERQPVVRKATTENLFRCPKCITTCKSNHGFKRHMNRCCGNVIDLPCPYEHCTVTLHTFRQMVDHYNDVHVERDRFQCVECGAGFGSLGGCKMHVRVSHRATPCVVSSERGAGGGLVTTVGAVSRPAPPVAPPPSLDRRKYGVGDADALPITPIFDSPVQCELCGFSTKVRLNMVRHLQLHAGRLPAPRSQPVNPVPHLETNEMHFDRMVNLASSSAGERPAPAARYPRHVPDRQRFACGATGCSYISVDEATLRRHWEALHAGAAAFRCAHCPPEQRLDSSKPLSAARIVAHLKMHGATLYACSACAFYHFKARSVERHAMDAHRGAARALPVREEGAPPPPPPAAPAPPIPTMDLKPWQCGLCEYKSMLRPAVADHCAAAHHCKMQFKCAYCPFRTSALENVAKHQSNAHPTRPAEVVHYYYREGSLPDDADAGPRWRRQRLLLGLPDLDIKEEPEPEPVPAPAPAAAPAPAPLAVDLNLVKKEVSEGPSADVPLEELCKQFGNFSEPNGIKYRCCLCSAVTTQTREEMQAHLFEELGYRRLGCGLCPYKAFHKAGLSEHTSSEHPRQSVAPSQLAVDARVERWVSAALDHQTDIIRTNKLNFAAQAIQIERPAAPAPRNVESPKPSSNTTDVELEHAFGKFGEAKGQNFSCPKCDYVERDEAGMRNHLESELTKIRWCCTECERKFTTYHEAQFHCRSGHVGGVARPREAIRDPDVRARWVSAVIDAQKQTLQSNSTPESQEDQNDLEPDNSLLVARYDEPAPIEPVQLAPQTLAIRSSTPQNKRPTPTPDSDEDDRLYIDEPPKKKPADKKCPYCDFSINTQCRWREHVITKHYNMKPYKCSLCTFTTTMRGAVLNHMEKRHPGEVHHVISEKIPNYPPPGFEAKTSKKLDTDDGAKKVCLYCEKSVLESEIDTHVHDNGKPEFAKRADDVLKCLKCLELRLNVTGMEEHFTSCHPIHEVTYASFKLQVDLREIHCCGHCYRKFKNVAHLKMHHSAMHSPLPLSYTSIPFNRNLRTECDSETGKRKLEDDTGPSAKRTARKSTSKLPSTAVAKKSTTKLPCRVPDSDAEEYSFYGTKPEPLYRYKHVFCAMPNSTIVVNMMRLCGMMKLDPKLVLKDCKQ